MYCGTRLRRQGTDGGAIRRPTRRLHRVDDDSSAVATRIGSTHDMTITALALYGVFIVSGFGWRSYRQWRRTGSTGMRGFHGRPRDISSKALRQMRGTDRVNQVKRAIASSVAPVVWPAGAWLANGPIQLPVPRPGTRNFY